MNILSIDGGGIRGIIPAKILEYVESKLKKMTSDNNYKLSDHFDLIVGTSTGGILTCLYTFPDENGNTKYSAKDAVDLYKLKGGIIFKKEFFYRLRTLFGVLGPRYRATNIEKLLKEYFSDVKISEATTNIMLTSVDTNNSSLFLFRNYKKDYSIFSFYDAARSTSAAPTYFPSNKIIFKNKELSLIDGGMAINNPSISAYIEARKMSSDEEFNLLSIGTGRNIEQYSYNKTKKWGILNWILKIFDVIMTSSSKAIEYETNLLYQTDIKGSYLRIDTDLKGASDKMDGASKENLLKLDKAATDSILLNKSKIDSFLLKSLR